MNTHQERAEARERVESAISYLREQTDIMMEISAPLIVARRAYDAVVMAPQEIDQAEALRELMEKLAEVGSIVDDTLSTLYEILEPEETEIIAEESREQMKLHTAKEMYERYCKRIQARTASWDDLTPTLRQAWLNVAGRSLDGGPDEVLESQREDG